MRAACVLILFCLHHQIKGLQRDRRSPSHPKKKKSTLDANKSNGELLCLIILFSVVYFNSGHKGSTKSTEVIPDDGVVEDYNDDLYASFYEDAKTYDSGGHFLNKLKQHLGMSVDFKSSKNGQEGIVIMHII